MSVCTVPEACPSRVLAILRLLVALPRHTASRKVLEELMTPPVPVGAGGGDGPEEGEQKPAKMLRTVVVEARGLGLLTESEDGEISISPGVLKSPNFAVERWPLLVFDLMSRPENGHKDLCRALAWLLAQTPGGFSGAWPLPEDVSSAFELNQPRFLQLLHWAGYLGFGWRCSTGKRETFIPDPSAHLKLRLAAEYGNRQRVFSGPEFLQKVGEWVPVLDSGSFRTALEEERILPKLPAGHLGAPLSQALLRLSEEGYIEMGHESDAEALLLWSPGAPERVSKIQWKGVREA